MKQKIIMSVCLLATLSSHPVRLMTFNLPNSAGSISSDDNKKHSWSKRKKAVVSFIKESGADIIGFQETMEDQVRYLMRKLKKAGYDWYGEVNKEFSFFGIESLAWIPQIFTRDVQYNPIFYQCNRFENLDEGTIWLSGEQWKPQEGTVVIRICSWIKFLDKESKREFYIFNTHLDHNANQQLRIDGIAAIINHLPDVPSTTPIFIMGDFNTGLYGEFKELLDKAEFIDSKELAPTHTGPLGTYVGWHNTYASAIDHIMVKNSESIAITHHETVTPQKTLSDHHPVSIDIEWA